MQLSERDHEGTLDPLHLSGFTGGDEDLEVEVLQIFQANAPGYLAVLESAGPGNWKPAAHKLKGAARGIGAWSLAREAERAEHNASEAADAEGREARLSQLRECLQQLNIAITARIKAIRDAEMIDHE
ncbi:Hpt domain-containing protein [Kordiimonas sp.]|uniref:Hpt domain-containing protein n=1 Tax=Kordiimonas sp. TaxID=1970157 RepID=UPI003A8E05C7